MSRSWSGSLLAAALVLSSGAGVAQAADLGTAQPQTLSTRSTGEDWYVTIGASGRLQPDYPGADDYTITPRLIFSITKASGLNTFRSVDDNPSIALFDTGTFRIGAVGRLDWGRDQDDNDRLRGMGDVDMSLELGGFAEWYPVTWLRLRGELRYGMGGYSGFVGDLAADVIIPYETWRFAVGPRLSYAGSGYMDAYFSVTPEQSTRAILDGNYLPVYSAGSGIDAYGVTAQLTKNFQNGFEAGIYGSYYRLASGAADSPLTSDANQFIGGISLSYTFNIGKSWW